MLTRGAVFQRALGSLAEPNPGCWLPHWRGQGPKLRPRGYRIADFASCHIRRCLRQSSTAAMGQSMRSRMGSRPRSVRCRNTISSCISGASCSRFMICVTRARLTCPRRASQGRRDSVLRHEVPVPPEELMSRAREVGLKPGTGTGGPGPGALTTQEWQGGGSLKQRSAFHFGSSAIDGASGRLRRRVDGQTAPLSGPT